MRKIGNIELKNKLILAPMAGVTNQAYRKICRKHNVGLIYGEMISDKGLLYKNDKTLNMLKIDEDEHPVVVQIFGSSVETLTEAAIYVEKHTNADIIDINMGCPVNKVVKNGAGSALLQNPDLIYEIIKSIKANVKLPLSIKIRAGWDHNSINCIEVVKKATLAGVDAIAIHGRTRSMLYRGESNIEFIKMVRDNTDVFVIGNGDVKTAEDAQKLLDLGCDAVMIGRASLGNPWIFDEINAGLNNEEYNKPSIQEVIDTVLLHSKYLIETTTEHAAMVEMRTHAVWYFKLLPNSKQYRIRLVHINNYQDLLDICNEYLDSLK